MDHTVQMRAQGFYPIYHGPYMTYAEIPDRLLGVHPPEGRVKAPFLIAEYKDYFEVVGDRREHIGPVAGHTSVMYSDRRNDFTPRRESDRRRVNQLQRDRIEHLATVSAEGKNNASVAFWRGLASGTAIIVILDVLIRWFA